jgi:glucosamine-6-phosphate deaminase
VRIHKANTKSDLGKDAAAFGAPPIRAAIETKGHANIILATGASQFDTIDALVNADGIDWTRVTAYHLDEYIGLPEDHPASFRRYLRERFVRRVPNLGEFVYVNGSADPVESEVARLNERLSGTRIDVCFCGIGENAHLAFNDPPADFDATDPFIIVELDEACRKQQLGEGWFEDLDDVPTRAISMTIPQILKSEVLIVSVPDERKAGAVRCSVEGPVTPHCPASILQTHKDCHLFLDPPSASLLRTI